MALDFLNFQALLAILKIPTVLAKMQTSIDKLEAHLSVQDDQIKAFADSVKASFTELGGNLDNIVTDESNLAKRIADLEANASGQLSAENQATLAGIASDAAAMATRTKTIADAVPDSIPTP